MLVYVFAILWGCKWRQTLSCEKAKGGNDDVTIMWCFVWGVKKNYLCETRALTAHKQTLDV